MKALMTLGVLFCVSSAFARIGETDAQIEARYGSPLASGQGYTSTHVIRSYQYHDYSIQVDFLDGKSASELFHTTGGRSFSEAEAQTILAANAVLDAWQKEEENSAYSSILAWKVPGVWPGLEAVCDIQAGTFLVEASWWPQWVANAKADAAKGL